jgi:uncharacterized protein (DUF4213/DUF364 family)
LKDELKGKNIPETKEVLIGKKFMAVLLEGYLGTGYAPRKDTPTCNVFNGAGTLHEKTAIELAEFASSDDSFERAVGVAALNALSQYIIDENKEKYNFYSNLDILKLLPLNPGSKVGMVGVIGPFVQYLTKNSREFVIVDDNPAIPEGKTPQGYIISRNIESIGDADIVLMTGSTIIEHSLEGPINVVKNATFKVVIGPTASWIPDMAFDLGLNAACGMRFKEPLKAFRTIMQGGGTRYFAKYADKYTLTKEKLPNIK